MFAQAESGMATTRLAKVEPLCQDLFHQIMFSPVTPILRKPSGTEDLTIGLATFWTLHDVSAQALLSESYRNAFAVSVYLAAASLYGGAPRERIRFERTNEGRSGSSALRVETDRGAYEAGHAIVTLPLGVLKRGLVRFGPLLSARKQGAIDRLAMGALNKIALVFPCAFWPADHDFLGYMSAERGEVPVMLSLMKSAGAPVLVGFVTGRYSARIASMPDAELQERVMRILRKMFGAAIPAPTHMVRTHWERDPFAFGSYAHIPVGADPSDMDILAEPLGRIRFAGEATHREHSGTVHGALLSGLREARRIIDG